MSKKILLLAPHTDDGELGCGATVARMLEEENEVYYAAFSSCEESVPEGLPRDTLRKELLSAMKVLGIPSENVLIYGYPVRRFSEYRQDILEILVNLQIKHKFDIVFMPNETDTHQDHTVIAQESKRAFKSSSIFSYELPWNQYSMNTDAFIEVQPHHLEKKIKVLEQYISQQDVRPYMQADFIKGLARVRGVQIKKPFAEAFGVVRWIY